MGVNSQLSQQEGALSCFPQEFAQLPGLFKIFINNVEKRMKELRSVTILGILDLLWRITEELHGYYNTPK